MKVAVSYISSKYDLIDTIKYINDTTADYIHMDIMDGKYVKNKNFNVRDLKNILKLATKKIDVHLMVKNPIKYLKYFSKSSIIDNIYFHVNSSKNPKKFIKSVNDMWTRVGIVINPDDSIDDIKHYLPYVNKILVMSVVPGAGGQKFIDEIAIKLDELFKYKSDNNLNFDVNIDGGINDSTIKKIKKYDINTVISGSFICKSDNYQEKINLLKNSK